MPVCTYGGEGLIISILQEPALNYILSEIVDRWKYLSPTMIDIKCYIPNNSRILVKLVVNKDIIKNMYEIKYISN